MFIFKGKQIPKDHHGPLFNASQGTMLMKKIIGIPQRSCCKKFAILINYGAFKNSLNYISCPFMVHLHVIGLGDFFVYGTINEVVHKHLCIGIH